MDQQGCDGVEAGDDDRGDHDHDNDDHRIVDDLFLAGPDDLFDLAFDIPEKAFHPVDEAGFFLRCAICHR